MKAKVLIDIVCKELELDYNKLIGIDTPKIKAGKYRDARHIIAYFLIDKGFRHIDVADELNFCNHSNSVYSVKVCKNLIDTKDKEFKSKFDRIKTLVANG